jgi:hypothetical protein
MARPGPLILLQALIEMLLHDRNENVFGPKQLDWFI